MKLKKAILIAIPFLTFAAGFLAHRYITRRVHDIQTPAAEQFSIIGLGGSHGQPFTLPAFETMHYEAEGLLRQVVGDSAASQRFIYVVPSTGGFDIYMHTYPGAASLSEQQTLQLRSAVWDRMRALSTPETASTK